jgi:Domain of unknown function DUF302
MTAETPRTHTFAHQVNRLVVDTDATFDELRWRYESLVPTIDFAEITDVIQAGDLSRVREYTAQHAPHAFVNFWTFDPTAMMRLAGHGTRAITYMMGNNIIVEKMFRHDPGIMLYAPMRTVVYEDVAGATHLSIDQPSSRYGSFGDSRITAVGFELDARLAELLSLMKLPVPAALNGGRLVHKKARRP